MRHVFPQICPDYCNDERTAEEYGCLGPTRHSQGFVDVGGERIEIFECPHRILARNPEAVFAVGVFFAWCDHGVLPNVGGFCDQSLGFQRVRSVCGAVRNAILREQTKRE